MKPVRVIFAGSDPIGLPSLDALAGGLGGAVELVGVMTQPDRPHGRGMRVAAGPIKERALALDLPVRQPEKIAPEDLAWLRERDAGLVVVMAYGPILRPDFLALPAHGVLNLHASILPAYRGASPIAAAIASGDAETGVALMRIVPALDAGPVHAVGRVAIAADETAATLWDKLAAAGAGVLAEHLPAVLAGTLPAVEQDAARATWCRRLDKDDGLLDPAAPAVVLARRARAVTPWPGPQLDHAGVRLRLGRVTAEGTGAAAPAGTILAADASLRLATGDGELVIHELQRPGGRMLPAREFLRGYRLAPGDRLDGAPLRPLVQSTPFRRAAPAAGPGTP